MNYQPKPPSFFLEMIGKRVFRDKLECCKDCDEIAENGLIVRDEDHAKYLAMFDADFAQGGDYLHYRETK